MAFGNNQFTKTDLFVKSSVSDLQDPTFLTFEVDFFPVPEEYPRYDGLWNSSLLPNDRSWFNSYSEKSTPPSGGGQTASSGTNDTVGNQDTLYRAVEFSAYEWLTAYYGTNYAKMFNERSPHPATALITMASELSNVQDAPWYFQSIGGIPDLWKQSHRVKEGNMKSTLTFNCLESIRQPLTTIAENYRWAVYDQERLSYRLPDNLRWFDMNISLIEARYLVDYNVRNSPFSFGQNNGLQLFEYSDGKLKRGIKVTTFKCKMCEFDFSDFLSGGGVQNEFSAITPDKPFSPAFKVNVGWVIHEEVDYEDAELMRQSNILTGALNAINRRISNTLSAITNLPNAVAGSLVNRAQTAIEQAALGNVYNPNSLNGLAGAINQFGAAITGRRAPVGPSFADLTNARIYPEPQKPSQVKADGIGDVYPDPPRPAGVVGGDLGDVYPNPVPPTPVVSGDLGQA